MLLWVLLHIKPSCGDDYGRVISEVIRRAVADVERRPNMEKIHQILINNQLDPESQLEKRQLSSDLEILCLGTGKGATTLLTGQPSSSFVILYKGKPLLIVDLGFGVVQSFRKYVGIDMCFERIFITHNHSDHAAELPVILAVICGRQSLPVVYTAPEVAYRLKTQRLNEITAVQKLEEFVDLKVCETGNKKTPIVANGKFSISVLPSQHSEACYGFILYKDNEPVLGYTGDSGFNRTLYDQLFTAPNVVIDARTDSTYEHAGFCDVINYLKDNKLNNHQIFITGYGIDSEYPEDGIKGAMQLRTGEKHPLLLSAESHIYNTTNEWCKPIRTNITAEYLLPSQGP